MSPTAVLLATAIYCRRDNKIAAPAGPQLSDLRISGARLEPDFSPEQIHYTLRHPHTVHRVAVAAFAARATHHLSINGAEVLSGQSREYAISAGDRLRIRLSDETGNYRIYSVLSLPADFPAFHTRILDSPSPGYIFLANYDKRDMQNPAPAIGRYLIILDQRIVPVWFAKSDSPLGDFKLESDSLFSYYHWNEKKYYTVSFDKAKFKPYAVTGKYNYTDSHDFILHPDGSYHLSTRIERKTPLSFLPADRHATFTEFAILKFDKNHHLLREWKSWEHFDAEKESGLQQNHSFSEQPIDYAHFNSLAINAKNDLLISRKHQSEVTLIDGKSGNIVWRLGGKNSQFRFEKDPLTEFNHQHCARFTPQGNILLYDNGKLHTPPQSRAVEYKLDLNRHTATLVWSFAYPGLYTEIMGSVQRLPDGNTFIGWGGPASDIAFTEVRPDGKVTTEVSMPPGQTSYRVQKFAWHPPYLED